MQGAYVVTKVYTVSFDMMQKYVVGMCCHD